MAKQADSLKRRNVKSESATVPGASVRFNQSSTYTDNYSKDGSKLNSSKSSSKERIDVQVPIIVEWFEYLNSKNSLKVGLLLSILISVFIRYVVGLGSYSGHSP
ncbi:hypothetical protein AYI69_g9357, partial [Smittium culicis]